MTPTVCPLCNQNAHWTNFDHRDIAGYDCGTCGRFEMSQEATYLLASLEHKGRLSAWTRAHHESDKVAYIDSARLRVLPSTHQGLNTEQKLVAAMEILGRRFSKPGQEISIGQKDWPLYCDTDAKEWIWLRHQLVDREWLTGAPTVNGYIKCSITARGWQAINETRKNFSQSDLCFVAMKFEPELKPYFEAVRRGAAKAGYKAQRVDTDKHADHIDFRLIDMLNRCRFVIADFSGDSHNVYFEAGYAKGLNKPVIWTKRSGQGVQFDTRQYLFLDWQENELAAFESELEMHIAAIVGRLPVVLVGT